MHLFHCRCHETGDKLSPMLCYQWSIIIGVIIYFFRQCLGDDGNPRQGLVMGVNNTNNNLSPVTTIPAIIYRRCHWHRWTAYCRCSWHRWWKTKLQISSLIFIKFVMGFWVLRGWFMKKNWSRKSGVRIPLNMFITGILSSYLLEGFFYWGNARM
jgi:hypothetical protein